MKNTLANIRGIQVFRSLRHRNYRLLWLNHLFVLAGYWILVMAQGWLVLQVTDSAFWVGMIAFMVGIPGLFLSPLGGLYADRFDRRKLMLFGHGISVLLIFLLAALTSAGVIAIWHIATISVLLGIVWALTDPASMAIIPSLVTPDDLLNATAMNTFAWQIGRLIGSAIAGVLMGLVALGGTFYGAGIAFVVTFILVFLIRAPTTIKAKRTSIGEDIKEGLSYVKSSKVALMLILLMAVVSLFALPYLWLMPVFARDVLGLGEAGYSQLMMAVGAGGLIGAIIAANLGDFKHKGWLLIGSALTFMGTLILFAMSRFFPLSLVLSVIIGGANGIFIAVTTALLLSIIPDQIRGRMMGLFTISWYLPSIGSLMLGAATDWIGLPVALITGASICTVFILGLVLRLPALRRM